MNSFYTRKTCRMCGSGNIKDVLPLTPTALCDAYIGPDGLKKPQELYPLDLFICGDCGYIHLPHVVDPEIIYRDYIYVTTSSMGLSEHFRNYADDVVGRLGLPEGSLVADIGSNDGTLLKFFKKRNMRALGVEPASKIAEEATKAGIETLDIFFNSGSADEIRRKYGSPTLITVNNLYANIDDLEDFTEGIRRFLSPEGIFVIESSYFADMMKNMVFDFIYHEHLSYFTIKPLINFLRRFGMECIDIQHVATKGGSLRYYFQFKGGPRRVSGTVTHMVRQEEALNLDKPQTFNAFRVKIEERKKELLHKLEELKSQNKSIAGYGGSATSTTLIHHFGLDKFLDYIVDDNPAKQNTYSPGFHIPVLPSAAIYERRPECVVILAWRYAAPIAKMHKAYMEEGGIFIQPLPELRIIGKLTWTEYLGGEQISVKTK